MFMYSNRNDRQIFRLFYRSFFVITVIAVALVLPHLSIAAETHSTTTNKSEKTEKFEIKGSLVIVGGALRTDNSLIWNTIIQQAGGKGAKIAVIPAASGNPDRSGNAAVDTLNKYGAKAFLVPLSVKYKNQDGNTNFHEIAQDPYWTKQVGEATGVFFTGGDQAKITQVLVQNNGPQSEMLKQIWGMYQRGGVIAGTSAGAAIMSTTMFNDAKAPLPTLKLGVSDGKEIANGLGFIGGDVFIDQHLIIRGRFARMLPVMLKKGYQLGLGIDENTALLVTEQNKIKIIGYKGAILLDTSQAKTDATISEFNIDNVQINYLDNGDQFELRTKKITPSADKSLITSPQSDDTQSATRVYNDILGNTTVVELMSNLLESSAKTAKGLAFGDETSVKPELGFEFNFKKTAQSKAYFSNVSGAEAFTVIDLRLTIRPITIQIPLYREFNKAAQ
jgi:cyanophycinase